MVDNWVEIVIIYKCNKFVTIGGTNEIQHFN